MADAVSETRNKVRWPRGLYRQGTEPDPRFTLANERTFLAWIRTSLAFIAGGIALNALTFEIDPGVKHWLSITSLSLGAVISAWAWYSWLRVELAMRNKTPLPHSPALIVLTTALLAVAVVAAIAFI